MSLTIRPIDDTIAVAPQIDPEDVPAIAAAGFVAILNNRPDGEEPGQPASDAVRTAAQAAGLGYTAIPVTQGFSEAQLDATMAMLDAADGPVLAYCRSGTRSCNLWALARARAGEAPQVIADKAAAAGYDLSALRPLLDTLSSRARTGQA